MWTKLCWFKPKKYIILFALRVNMRTYYCLHFGIFLFSIAWLITLKIHRLSSSHKISFFIETAGEILQIKRDRRKRSIKVPNSPSILSPTEAAQFRSHKEIQNSASFDLFFPITWSSFPDGTHSTFYKNKSFKSIHPPKFN